MIAQNAAAEHVNGKEKGSPTGMSTIAVE